MKHYPLDTPREYVGRCLEVNYFLFYIYFTRFGMVNSKKPLVIPNYHYSNFFILETVATRRKVLKKSYRSPEIEATSFQKIWSILLR